MTEGKCTCHQYIHKDYCRALSYETRRHREIIRKKKMEKILQEGRYVK